MPDIKQLVVRALLRQEKNGYANLVLKSELAQVNASRQQRALLATLFYGTIERLYTLDWMLNRVLARPIQKANATVRAILRSGLYQIHYMDTIPVYAAVNDSVLLCKKMGQTKAAGLVNAVLRKASEIKLDDALFEHERQRICVTYSVSDWVAQTLYKAYPNMYEEILKTSFVSPAFAVRVNTMKISVPEFCGLMEQMGFQAQPGQVEGSVILDWKGNIADFLPFQQGFFHVQGQASQLACEILDPQPGECIMDLCAAPGGKTMTIAQKMKNQGQVFAFDLHASRVELIEQQAHRLGITCVQAKTADASQQNDRFLNCADRVLCDVPCTGLGVLAKKPDIRYKTKEGVKELLCLQRQILHTGAKYVKQGGVLVYATCTLNLQENEQMVTEFLKTHPDFEQVESKVCPDWAQQKNCMITVFPCKQADGFFIAKLQRKDKI